MIVRILLAAIVAGLLSGVFYTAAQAVKVVPLILKAETFENSGDTAMEAVPEHQHSAAQANVPHQHPTTEPWAPTDGFERTFYSLLSNGIFGVGNALLLAAVILFSKMPISPRSGLLWGAAGFVVFVLAPGLGLPPELPGMAAAPIPVRQFWWISTVLLTAGGLALFAFKTQWYWLALGVIMIVTPHVIGAPQPVEHASMAPTYLAVEFVFAAIVTNGLFWLFLGGTLGWLLPRAMNDKSEQPA